MTASIRVVKAEREKSRDSIANALRVLISGFKYLARPIPRFTILYPRERVIHDDYFRGFITLDVSKCIGCSSCERICPAKAITMTMVDVENKKKRLPTLNYQRCIFCGFCVDVCPVNALIQSKRLDQAYGSLDAMIVKPGDSPLILPEEGEPYILVVDEDKGLVKVRLQ